MRLPTNEHWRIRKARTSIKNKSLEKSVVVSKFNFSLVLTFSRESWFVSRPQSKNKTNKCHILGRATSDPISPTSCQMILLPWSCDTQTHWSCGFYADKCPCFSAPTACLPWTLWRPFFLSNACIFTEKGVYFSFLQWEYIRNSYTKLRDIEIPLDVFDDATATPNRPLRFTPITALQLHCRRTDLGESPCFQYRSVTALNWMSRNHWELLTHSFRSLCKQTIFSSKTTTHYRVQILLMFTITVQ